nr:glycosyltransferase family A protein [Chamaesiphon sp. OTE_75_metabat_556]
MPCLYKTKHRFARTEVKNIYLEKIMVVVPKVSVIVPAYNIASYIADTLMSVETQTFRDFEVLVIDDGSTDDTAKQVKIFCRRDDRFQLLQKDNGGLASARNYGMRHARGEYIALLDGDDLYKPNKLANHVARLDRNAEAGVVYSASAAIRDDGGSTFISLSGRPLSNNLLFSLLCKNFIGHGSNAVFRRCIVEDVGGFDETLPSAEDIDYWLRIAATGKWTFDREPQVLCCYRVRPSGLSFNVAEMQRCGERVIKGAYQRSPDLVEPMLPTASAYMYRYLARLSITSSDRIKAREYIDLAWKSDRSIFLRDLRSLLTLVSVRLAPIAQIVIRQSLGSSK